MKTVLKTLTLALTLTLGVSTQLSAKELAGVKLGMSAKEARAIIEKNYPEHNVYAEFEETVNNSDATYKTEVFRKIDPSAKYTNEQEFSSIAIVSLLKTGEVFQVARYDRVEPGTMTREALLKASEAQFGKPASQSPESQEWYTADSCRIAGTRKIEVPGQPYFELRYFNMDEDQFVNAYTFRTFPEGCDYVVHMNYEKDLYGSIEHYATTIANPETILSTIKKEEREQADASGTPKF